ncbi:MAG TPA: recombinase family protein [Vicinamibacterales bacterium]|nr:recombinase family protein [Vicinamibacterales bacterium]
MTVTGGRAVAYRRVSTVDQADSGLGLEAQQTAIETAAARLGLSLAETFTDAGVSGGVPLEGRPNLVAAIDALTTGDTLVIARRDRLGRDVLNVAMLARLVERKGARIVSAAGEGTEDDSPTSVLMRQIIDAFAEYERAIIRARTKSAMAAARARGQRVGCIPFGMTVAADGRTLVPNLDERAVLAEIRRLRARGYCLISIADELNQRGLRNRQGREWKASFVGQLLERHP